MSSFCRWTDDTLILSVRIQPRASRDEIVGVHDDSLKIRITAPPVDGKANAHLIKYLAAIFAVPRARVTLLSGESGRNKHISIDSPGRLPAIIPAP